jgi:hypothetical protein
MSLAHRVTRRSLVTLGASIVAVTVLGVAGAAPASACGGLIGENGSIQLVRTTTLAAWHDGIEHYVTSFEFSGTGEAVGSIIPLPGVPTSVEPAGEWTLQRLQREVAPVERFALAAAGSSSTAEDQAQVLLTAKVDALDITVLRGGGDAVGEWALANGFFLTPDAPEVLDFYASRSQIFLAAKFDAARAAAQGLTGGDGTPIHITIPTDRPWVPLRILALGLPADQQVQADVFLLTDDRPALLAGGGIGLRRSERASGSLMTDLRSDRNMDWMPASMWLSYLSVDERAGNLRYDLSASTAERGPSPLAAGYPFEVGSVELPDGGWGVESYAAAVGAVLAMTVAAALVRRRHRRAVA